jgi:hypothetical protein
MISRAARRTIRCRIRCRALALHQRFNFSRVRSDAGILSIGVLLRWRPGRQTEPRSDSPYSGEVHPNPFSSNSRTSPRFNGHVAKSPFEKAWSDAGRRDSSWGCELPRRAAV